MEFTADGLIDGPLACDERTGWARRLCRAVRRVMVIAGRGSASGVPF